MQPRQASAGLPAKPKADPGPEIDLHLPLQFRQESIWDDAFRASEVSHRAQPLILSHIHPFCSSTARRYTRRAKPTAKVAGMVSGRRSARSASPAGDAVPAGRPADQATKAEEDGDEDTAGSTTEEEEAEEETEDADGERDQDGRAMEEGDGFEWGAGDLRLQATLQVLPLPAPQEPTEGGPLDFCLPGGPLPEGILSLDEMMWGPMTGGGGGGDSGVELVDWGPMTAGGGGGGCIGSGSSLSIGGGGGGGGGDLDWGPMAICGCSDGGGLLDMASLLLQQGVPDGGRQGVSLEAEAWPGFGAGPPSSSSSDPLLQPDLIPMGTPCDGFALLRWGPVHFPTQISRPFLLPLPYSSDGSPVLCYTLILHLPLLDLPLLAPKSCPLCSGSSDDLDVNLRGMFTLVKETSSGGGVRPFSGSEVHRQVEADGGLMMPLPEEGSELDAGEQVSGGVGQGVGR